MVKMNPDAPTNDPATRSRGLLMMKPVKAAAIPDNEFSSETTTGMSAPPMGNTNSTPSTLEDAKSRIGQRASRGSFTKATVKTTTNATKSTLTTFSHAGPQVGAAHHFPKMDTPPNNFNTASNEPVRVHQPMMAENPAAPNAMVLVKGSGRASSDASTNFQHSAEATSAEAAPPKPLNSATSSGIEVVLALHASMRPIKAPAPMGSKIRFQLVIGPVPNSICTRAVPMATAMPREDRRLPSGAVRGWLSFFKPKMKSTAAIKYPKGIHISASP